MNKVWWQKFLRSGFLFIAAAALVFSPSATLALSDALLDQYAENNILYYDPDDSGNDCINLIVTNDGANPMLSTATDNLSAVYGYLISSGYSENAAAAIMGNLLNESSAVNPKLLQGGRIVSDDFVAYQNGSKTFNGGFGIAQWTSVGRVANLQAFADSLGLPVTSLEAQAKFLAQEVSSYGFSPSVLNSYSLEEATYVIYKSYESPRPSLSLPKSYQEFIANYSSGEGYQEYIERLNAAAKVLGATPGSLPSSTICSGGSDNLDEYPHYLQCDPRWGGLHYGKDGINGSVGSTICNSGCGPSSFAMLATVLLGREITPDETTDVAGKAGMYIAGAGSSNQITKVLADHYGLRYEHIPASNATEAINTINTYLRNGWKIHVSGAGVLPFSGGGHYIGIYGVTSEGKWILADSGHAKVIPRKESQYTWDPVTVVSAGLNLSKIWAIK